MVYYVGLYKNKPQSYKYETAFNWGEAKNILP